MATIKFRPHILMGWPGACGAVGYSWEGYYPAFQPIEYEIAADTPADAAAAISAWLRDFYSKYDPKRKRDSIPADTDLDELIINDNDDFLAVMAEEYGYPARQLDELLYNECCFAAFAGQTGKDGEPNSVVTIVTLDKPFER